MAGKAPSRLKSEKAHLSKPYEKPKSILRKVASTVKDLLLPSWLTSSAWSTSPEDEDSERDNGPCVPEAEDVTRRNEDGAPEEANAEAPAVPTFSRRERETPFEATRDGFDCSFVPREEPSRLPSASTPVHPSARNADGPALMNGDNHSENSEGSGSTSGCSSLVPSLRPRDTTSTSATCTMSGLTLSEEALERLRQDLSSRRDFGVSADLPPQSSTVPDTRQDKLWSESTDTDNHVRSPQTSASGRHQPSFTLSAFSMLTPSGTKRKAEGPYRSLFYEGRTTYGGASAYKRFSLVNRSTPYGSQQQEQSSMTTVNTQKRAKKDDGVVCMSSTTQRILAALEKASTPLSEAKKVPLNRGSRDPILSYVPLSQRRRMALREVSTTQPVRGPPNTSLSRPIPIRLEKNLDSILMERTTRASPEVATSIPTESQAVLPTREVVPVTYSTDSQSREETGRGGGKIRAQVVQHHRPSARREESEEVVQVPDLPSVPLPITTLPSFNFRPAPTAPSSSASATSVATSSSPPLKKVESTESVDCEFKFSAPVFQEAKDAAVSANVPPVEFTFSKPVFMDTGDKPRASPATNSFEQSTPVNAKRKASSMSELSKSQDDAGSLKPASQLILEGSVMDILGKAASKRSNVGDASKTAVAAPGSGPSDQPNTAGNVFGSSAVKTTAAVFTTSSAPTTTSNSGFGDKFKPAASTWECDTCLVRNSGNAKKCVACEAPKPGAEPPVKKPPAMPPAVTGFGDKFKPASSSWECGTCMVRNKAEDIKCVCCETPKPGAPAPAPASTKPETPFKFGVPSESVSTKPSATAEFTFGVSPNAPGTSSPGTGFKLAFATSSQQSAPVTFKFGVPATSTASTTLSGTSAGFNFGTSDVSKEPVVLGTAPSSKPLSVVDSPAGKVGARACATDSALGKGGLASFGVPLDASGTAFKLGASDDPKRAQKDSSEESPAKKAFSFGAVATSTAKTAQFNFNPPKTDSSAQGFSFGPSGNSSAPAAEAGTVTAASVKSSESSSGFSFSTLTSSTGASANPASTRNTDSAASKGLFSFGTPSSKPAEGSNTLAGFKFGDASKKAEEPKGSAFSFGKAETTSETPGFSFGSPAAAKSENSATEKGGFSFKVAPLPNTVPPTADATKSTFSFNPSPKKDDGTKSGFVFGGATTATTKPTFTFGVPQASEPAAATVATTAPKFVFGQKNDLATSTFTFGAQPAADTTAPSSASQFSFKAAGPTATVAPSQPAGFGSKTDTPSATPFGFGGTPTVAPSPAAPAPFSFGVPKSEPAPAAPQSATQSFSFGASTPSQAPAAAAAAPPSAQPAFSFGASQPASTANPQGFKFGGNSSAPAPTPFGSAAPVASQAGTIAPPAANTGFNFPVASPFGANQSQAAATASPFGASQPQATASTPFGAAPSQAAPNLFGASAGQTGGAPAPGFSFRPPAPTAAPTFQFGGSAPPTQEVFRFGAQAQSQDAQPQQPSGFNFNPPVAGAAPVFGQQVAAPAFNFNAAVPGAAPGGFPFQASAENPFSATGSGALAGRKIRKAVRRKPPLQR